MTFLKEILKVLPMTKNMHKANVKKQNATSYNNIGNT